MLSMAAALHWPLLAGCLLALRAVAFVPGGALLYTPHVRMRPLTRRKSVDTRAGEQAALPRRRGAHRLRVALNPAYNRTTASGAPIVTVSPEMRPLTAISIVDAWQSDAARLAAQSSADGDGKSGEILEGAQRVLGYMRDRLATLRGPLDYVFALTDGPGAQDVQAIASVFVGASHLLIHEIVAKPADDQEKHIAELHHRIRGWAGDRTVIIMYGGRTPAMEYYRGLGVDLYGSKKLDGAPHEEQAREEQARMIALKISMTPPSRVQLNASKVIGAWAREAAAALSRSREDNDTARAQLVQNTQCALSLMNHTVLDGGIHHLFALTRDSWDIQALATVTTHNWDDRLKRKEVVVVNEVVASPGADGHKHVAELICRIHSWAGDAFFTVVQQVTGLNEYYANLGFDPDNMVLANIGNKLPTPEDKFRMIELEPEVPRQDLVREAYGDRYDVRFPDLV